MRRWEMGDPMMVAMRREEASCKGCKYKLSAWGKETCEHPMHEPKKSKVELRKCRFYELKGVANES